MSVAKSSRPHPVSTFPRCSETETYILQMRADGYTFAQISKRVKLNPRKTSDLYFGAMRKVVKYLEQDCFLRSQ